MLIHPCRKHLPTTSLASQPGWPIHDSFNVTIGERDRFGSLDATRSSPIKGCHPERSSGEVAAQSKDPEGAHAPMPQAPSHHKPCILKSRVAHS